MNKRVTARRPKSAQDLAKTPVRPAKLKQLKSRSRELEEEIYTLECTIAAAPEAMRRHRLATKDVLPAIRPLRSAKRAPARVPLHLQKAARRRQFALLLELGLVVATFAAVVGWMNQWFHWWN